MFRSLTARLLALLALPVLAAMPAFAQGASQEAAPSILLFDGANYSQDAREIYDVTPYLRDLGFNDRPKSLVVIAGVWEVCEHEDFRGRCIVVRQDVRDLREFRLNRNISSVRPIYEYTDAQHGLMFKRGRDGQIRYLDDYYNPNRRDYANYRDNGYNSSSIYINFGSSRHYRNHGYYHPRLGYGPFGYGYGRSHYGYGHGYGHSIHRPRRVHRRRPRVDRPHRRDPDVHRPRRDPDIDRPRRRPVTDRPHRRDPDSDRRPRRPDIAGTGRPDRRRPDRRRRPELDGGADVSVGDTGPAPRVRRPDRRPRPDAGSGNVQPRTPRPPRTDRPRRRPDPVIATAPQPQSTPRPRRPRVDRPHRGGSARHSGKPGGIKPIDD